MSNIELGKSGDQANLEAQASQYIDLVSERFGGRALRCSDQWFANCDHLVKPGRGEFQQGLFSSTGQVMDGWESRRSFRRGGRENNQGDWCILRLGTQGQIRIFDIDTNHFKGNAPEKVSVQAIKMEGNQNPDENADWTPILEISEVNADSQNYFVCTNTQVWTHLKLNMFPDGGIARFRAYGEVKPNPKHYIKGELVDLASASLGGRSLDASDRFYSSPNNLIMPGRGVNMGDGWETKRRRDQSNDWCILKLGKPGTIRKVVLDTAHFKGNYPDTASLEAININELSIEESELSAAQVPWEAVIEPVSLNADMEHLFIEEIQTDEHKAFTHIRLNIFPDGGVSRLRIFGEPNWI